MKILRPLIFLVFCAQTACGQNHIPKDLKKSSVLVVEYSYDDWDMQFLDSTSDQWLLNRYGKDRLYKAYKDTFDKAVKTLKKHRIQITIIDSRSSINKSGFNYLFDYKQKFVDNNESIVAHKRLGGFFFEDLRTKEKFDPIVENKKYMKTVIKRALTRF